MYNDSIRCMNYDGANKSVKNLTNIIK